MRLAGLCSQEMLRRLTLLNGGLAILDRSECERRV